MSAAEAREQIGKFEFSVAVAEKKPDGERRVDALANWLLAEWERERSSSRIPTVRIPFRTGLPNEVEQLTADSD